MDIQKALLNKKEIKKRLQLSRQAKVQAEENFRLVADQFKHGLISNTEFLDAETLLTKSKIDELRAIADFNIAVADLERATGKSVNQ